MNVLNDELIDMLRCPVTLSRLRRDGDWLEGETGGLRYPIRDGIPVLLAEEATLPSGVETLEAFKLKFKDQMANR